MSRITNNYDPEMYNPNCDYDERNDRVYTGIKRCIVEFIDDYNYNMKYPPITNEIILHCKSKGYNEFEIRNSIKSLINDNYIWTRDYKNTKVYRAYNDKGYNKRPHNIKNIVLKQKTNNKLLTEKEAFELTKNQFGTKKAIQWSNGPKIPRAFK